MEIGSSARLVLRFFNREDGEIFSEYRNNKELNQYQGWKIPFTNENWENFIGSMENINLDTEDEWIQIALTSKDQKELIGDIGFHRKSKQVELGITIRPEFQKLGFAKEALKVIIQTLIEKFQVHRFVAFVDTENISSISLFKSLGFRKEGHLVQSYWDENVEEWRDEFLFALLSREITAL